MTMKTRRLLIGAAFGVLIIAAVISRQGTGTRVLLFLGGLVALIVANKVLRFDVDTREPGSPRRKWDATAAYPKSYVHALQAFTLMLIAVGLAGIPILPAFALVFGALLIFEWTQGFIDWIDVGANGVGAAFGAALMAAGGAA